MKATQRREQLRAVLAGPRCILPASVYDPLSARIAQSLEFEALMFAGSTASLAVLGDPDLALITLTEFADQARRITRAVDIPVLADADHGYGNALNVSRTVEELEAAGVAALTIEDTDLPQPFRATGPSLIPIKEGVGKMKAALAARDDASLIIAGRTGATATTGVDDAIARCKAYEDAGVDALFLSGVERRDDLEKICRAVSRPVMLGTLSAEVCDLDYLSDLGVRIGLIGHWPLRAAVAAMRDTMQAMKGHADYRGSEAAASADLMSKLSRAPHFQKATKDFLT